MHVMQPPPFSFLRSGQLSGLGQYGQVAGLIARYGLKRGVYEHKDEHPAHSFGDALKPSRVFL